MPSLTTLEMIRYDKRDGIAVITLDRPAVLNALNRQTIEELGLAIGEAGSARDVAGVILTGAGDRAFAAGADIKELARLSPVEAKLVSAQGHALMDAIETLGKPVVAAVNGYALGGGCELAMACTIRIAAEGAKFGQPEVSLGLIPGFGGSQRLPRLVGKGRAMQIILSARAIDAQEALRIGLVNEVVPATALLARAEAILSSMTANGPVALRFAIEAVNRGLDMTQAEGCAYEAGLFGLCAATEDRAEGTGAFLAKRKPAFQGR